LQCFPAFAPAEYDIYRYVIQKPKIVETIRNKILQWAGHARRSRNPLIRVVLEEGSIGKIPLGRARLRWDDIEALGGGLDWKTQASDRENLRQGCVSGWS